jgi:hypothetical protein
MVRVRRFIIGDRAATVIKTKYSILQNKIYSNLLCVDTPKNTG